MLINLVGDKKNGYKLIGSVIYYIKIHNTLIRDQNSSCNIVFLPGYMISLGIFA